MIIPNVKVHISYMDDTWITEKRVFVPIGFGENLVTMVFAVMSKSIRKPVGDTNVI